ncbi:surface protease GP63, partial [Trypanosoma theileri]
VQSTGVVRELPRKGQSGVQAYTVATQENEGWKLIRIKAFTRDLEDTSRYCTKAGQEVIDFVGTKATCFEADVLNDEKHREYIKNIIPAAIKLHRERLRVQPHKGKIIVTQLEGDYCENFTIPEEHRTEGVDADFVLYVAAIPWHWWSGVTCAREKPSGRPIVGVMSFIPSLYGGLRLNVRRFAHEMAHALGFNIFEMDKKNMLFRVGIRGMIRTVVRSHVAMGKVKEHYGCPDLEGVELAQADESHWVQRVAKDELMAAPSESGAGYYTALTMSTFEGLGYYKANWGMEEPMSWGHKGGCDFLKETCTENEKHFSDQFCNDTTALGCTSDRTAYGMCSQESQRQANPSSNDVCHLIGGSPEDLFTSFSYCTEARGGPLTGSLMGPDSWCLDGEGLQVQNAGGRVESLSGVCARVSCDEGRRAVEVQYKGSDTFKE